MSATVLTSRQIQDYIAAIRKKDPDTKFIGIHTPGSWPGPASLENGMGELRIRPCRSPLELRLALQEPPPPEGVSVLLTPFDEKALGQDVLVRLARQRLHRFDAWRIVQSRFKAQRVDPRVTTHPWLADFLIECEPPEGFPPVPSGFLDAETVWKQVLDRLMDLDSGEPDPASLLIWSLSSDRVGRLRDQEEPVRSTVLEWIMHASGACGAFMVRCALSNRMPDTAAVGLVAGIVYDEEAGGKLDKAAGKLEERHMGGESPDRRILDGWIDSVEQALLNRVTEKERMQILRRADEILQDIQAQDFAGLSDFSPLGWDQRLAFLGDRMIDALDHTKSIDLRKAHRQVQEHRLSKYDPLRMERIEMAIRLIRWLHAKKSVKDPDPVSLPMAGLQYMQEGSFIDWARLSLRSGDPVQALSNAYKKLFDRITSEREKRTKRFAERLAEWTHAGSKAKDLILVEQFLDEVAVPLSDASEDLLILVMDGMSAAVFRELVYDITSHEWTALKSEKRSYPTPVIASIPSRTEFSRASLLCGKRMEGTAIHEKAGFQSHEGLKARCRSGSPPVLFHKGDLAQNQGDDVRQAIRSSKHRVVGVVINAIDDFLLKGDQLNHAWRRNEIHLLSNMLHDARDAGRIVILVSDHGHVLDCGTKALSNGEGGERWRVADSQPGADEILISGDRVLHPDGRIIALWSEKKRYSIKKNGYHGGVSPQEMVIPWSVLTTGSVPEGWQEAPVETPEWWDDWADEPKAAHIAGERVKRKTRKKPLERAVVDGRGQAPLFPAPASGQEETIEEPSWIGQLLRSPVFEDQKRYSGRSFPKEPELRRLLLALDERGGKMTARALARVMQCPAVRLPGLIAVVQRVLNVDGYAVLDRNDSSDTVELNKELLCLQFGLE